MEAHVPVAGASGKVIVLLEYGVRNTGLEGFELVSGTIGLVEQSAVERPQQREIRR